MSTEPDDLNDTNDDDEYNEEPALDFGLESESREAVVSPEAYRTGIVEDLDHYDYLGINALSSTFIKEMIGRSPLHAKFARDNDSKRTRASTRHFDIGTAVHMGILEPDLYHDEKTGPVILPEYNLRKKDDKADYANFLADHEDRCVLKPVEKERADKAIASALRHPGVQALLAPAHRTELSIFWQDAVARCHCKARFDVLRDDLFAVDVKTTRDASPDGFMRQLGNLGYYIQAGHYNNGAEHVLNASLRAWAFIALEVEPPYGVATYVLQPDAVLRGMHLATRATEIYAECIESGYWPSYADTIEPISVARYLLKEFN